MSEEGIVSIEMRDKAMLAVVRRSKMDSDASSGMRKEITAAAANVGELPVILVMTNVEFVGSTWFNAIVELLEESKQRGSSLILAEIRPQIREALALTRLNELFEIYNTVDDALAHVDTGS